VNEWVKENMKGLIEFILFDKPSPDTRLILLNAIYFKGKWSKPFDKELTQKLAFYNNGTEAKVETDFMFMYEKSFQYAESKLANEKVQIVELAYNDEATSMVIILPGARDGLKKILNHEDFASDLSKLIPAVSQQTCKTKIDFYLPKFKFETEYDLNDTLTDMGMGEMFDEKAADFSDITGRKDLCVSLVKHKAVIKVDEEGTEAAAVTAVMMMRCCAMVMEKKIEFRADHPFLFLIKDKTSGIVLFIGKVESF